MKLKLTTIAYESRDVHVTESEVLDEKDALDQALRRAFDELPQEVREDLDAAAQTPEDGYPTFEMVLEDMEEDKLEEAKWPAQRQAYLKKGYTAEQADRLRMRKIHYFYVELLP